MRGEVAASVEPVWEPAHDPRAAPLRRADTHRAAEIACTPARPAGLGFGAIVLHGDVRQPDEYAGELGHVPGSRLIPLSELAARVKEIVGHKSKEIVCICRAGVRSTTAAAMLTGLGFERVRNMKGGMLDWNDAALPVER